MENTERGRVEVGYRTGNLTVVSKTDERKNGYTVWLCRCSCGGTIRLDTRALQRGTVSDCGCVTKVRPGQKDLSGAVWTAGGAGTDRGAVGEGNDGLAVPL